MIELPRMIMEALTQHIPTDASWAPLAGIVLLGVFGLVLMIRGARLAPAMTGLVFLGIGGIAGSFVAQWTALPPWPTIVVVGGIGLALGLTLFKIWLATLVAACFIFASLTVYGVKVVSPYIPNYTSHNFDEQKWVTLPEPGQAAELRSSAQSGLVNFWNYLATEVPNFQASFVAIILATGLAGFIFGWMLPKASRALWAATAGTFCFLFATLIALEGHWPQAANWLQSTGPWMWAPVLALWFGALVYNLVDIRDKRVKVVDEDDGRPKAVTA